MSWIGVDLDGTLAYYDGWRGMEHIGDPIPVMMARVIAWHNNGTEVRIVTARAKYPTAQKVIGEWCQKHLGFTLPITDKKDFGMITLWDDRCVRVEKNTGKICLGEE